MQDFRLLPPVTRTAVKTRGKIKHRQIYGQRSVRVCWCVKSFPGAVASLTPTLPLWEPVLRGTLWILRGMETGILRMAQRLTYYRTWHEGQPWTQSQLLWFEKKTNKPEVNFELKCEFWLEEWNRFQYNDIFKTGYLQLLWLRCCHKIFKNG